MATSTKRSKDDRGPSYTLNVALIPAKQRYQFKSEEILEKMIPLKKLPKILRPRAIKGLTRFPPVLRQGFPITEETWRKYLQEYPAYYKTIPLAGQDEQALAILLLEDALGAEIGYSVECHRVYGLPASPYKIIAELRNNYDVEVVPDIAEAKLRESLLLSPEAEKLWYLDYAKCNWDWKDLTPGKYFDII